MSHETDSGIAGLFFNIYSFKLAKDQINTLNHSIFSRREVQVTSVLLENLQAVLAQILIF